jgi:hypothetical protein
MHERTQQNAFMKILAAFGVIDETKWRNDCFV